eukprot:278950_1
MENPLMRNIVTQNREYVTITFLSKIKACSIFLQILSVTDTASFVNLIISFFIHFSSLYSTVKYQLYGLFSVGTRVGAFEGDIVGATLGLNVGVFDGISVVNVGAGEGWMVHLLVILSVIHLD